MGLFGKKHHFSIGKFARKFSINNIKRFAKKASHVAHNTLAIADRATSAVQRVSKAVAKGASAMSGIPVIGGVAGVVATGARQVGTIAGTAHRGVKGLEKATSKIEHHANRAMNVMETKSKPIKSVVSPPSTNGGNPLSKGREQNLF